RSEEHVPVQTGGRGFVGLVADRLAALVAESLAGIEFADNAVFEALHRFHDVRRRAALLADLHHAAVLARGGDDLLAFENVVARRLLAIDVLARLDGPDGGEHVPVIRRGDGDRVDALILEGLAHVYVDFWLLVGGA